ncbi:DUF6113 family protein [Streptomyces sp. NPDC051567]|uniref:DUF6113 family protein n=1 Tax=Streptomyces sp. NPDC051567 TaxID=3365660 RepID=UPI00378FB199
MSAAPAPGRIAAALGLLAAGVLTGAAGWLVVDLWFPGGLALALLALLGLFLGGRTALGTGLGVGAPAAGWFLSYVLLSTPRPEGDFLLGSSEIGVYVYLLGGAVAAVMSATLHGPADRQAHDARPVR